MLLRALCLACLSLTIATAAVTALRVTERTEVEQGKPFGPAGAYQRITGTAHFSVDPRAPANQLVRDLQLAPRNAAGQVEFSADFYILQPRDPAKANGSLLFEVSNRGGKGLLLHFDLAAASRNPGTTAGDLGDGYLLEQGYTLAWVGWQFDTPAGADILHLYAPIARNADGSPIRGKVRADFVLDTPANSASLADMGHRPYAAVDTSEPGAILTVRDRIEDARTAVPRNAWRFAKEENGSVTADSGSVYMAAGFTPGKIYEVIYTAQDPPIVGLGPAAVRDFIAFLKHGGPATPLGDQRYLKRAIGYGISQSARFLRDFVYEGFNADEQGRIVFDGVWAHVGGAGRGNFNYRFAQPSRDSRPFLNFFYPVDIFPFTDLAETDGASSAGLLDRARRASVVPKIFYTNGSYEYWGRAAALIHVTPDGSHDAPLAPDTRIYYIAGAQHTPGRLPPARTTTANLSNPEDYRFALRALLKDFQAWLKDGTPPPASRYPLRETHELVPVAGLHFPAIPGAHLPTAAHRAYRVDYGPAFAAQGILTEPPAVGASFPLLVPRVNADGNEISGIHLPEMQVPLGTYTGWNFRTAAMRAPTEMSSFIGSFFPFARTKQERLAQHDPRASIEERYATEDIFLQRITAAARSLVAQRLLLKRDIPAVVARAKQQWQAAVASREGIKPI